MREREKKMIWELTFLHNGVVKGKLIEDRARKPKVAIVSERKKKTQRDRRPRKTR